MGPLLQCPGCSSLLAGTLLSCRCWDLRHKHTIRPSEVPSGAIGSVCASEASCYSRLKRCSQRQDWLISEGGGKTSSAPPIEEPVHLPASSTLMWVRIRGCSSFADLVIGSSAVALTAALRGAAGGLWFCWAGTDHWRGTFLPGHAAELFPAAVCIPPMMLLRSNTTAANGCAAAMR